eukprot:4161590-Amphidinium_carterae.1
MKDVRSSARSALGKGTSLRRSSPLDLWPTVDRPGIHRLPRISGRDVSMLCAYYRLGWIPQPADYRVKWDLVRFRGTEVATVLALRADEGSRSAVNAARGGR